MDWFNIEDVKNVVARVQTGAQTGAQLISTINQYRQSVQQQNGNGNGEEISVRQSQQIAISAAPRTGESSGSVANQNLHGDFTREVYYFPSKSDKVHKFVL
jgi:hypothetical protein